MNNFERIKAMSIDEMAEFFLNKTEPCELEKLCKDCVNNEWCSLRNKEDFIKWLLS